MSCPSKFGNVLIRASAGTGKTYQLAVRYIGILAAGGKPEEILATTFTRKAAGEILDRVLGWLASAAADDEERAKLAAAIGEPSLTKERCCELLRTTVARLHALRVGTLDSYFLRVATSFGHELGLPPGWAICDELADAVLREEAIEQVLSGRVADLLTLVHSLTKGATSRSVARLVNDTVSSLLELYRETSPEAWKQLKLGRPLETAELDKLLAAIEGLAIDNKRMSQARLEDLERFRAEAWDDFLGKGLATKVLSGQCVFYNKPLPDDVVSLYQRWLKHVEAIVVGQVARQTEATHDLLQRFSEHYQALQLAERALRFSDVTFHLASAAAELAPERLAFRLDGGIRHVLLDEFQDTSPVQWRVLRPLAQSVTRQTGGSFFCVGDGKQAIYGWRGGVAAIFDALESELAGLDCQPLSVSHRSSQPVIDAVNEVFQNLARHPDLEKLAEPVAAWQAAFPQHTTAKTELKGYVELCTAPEAKDDERQADVTLRYAAKHVCKLVEAAPSKSIGVLVRTNTAVARMIYELRRLGIPASEEGGNPLIDSPAVELILSLLKLADHPADTVARFHLATSPLAEALEFSNWRSDAQAAALSQQLRRELLEAGYGATVFRWAKVLAASCDERDLSRLQQLVELAYEYSSAATLRTSDFLRLVERRRIADPQAAAVRVMTIHQAKGLEFDVVVLPELDVRLVGQPDRVVAGRPSPSEPVNLVCRLANENVRQFFPPALQKLFHDDMCLEVSESLCLLYVAMTRAVHALHMIVPPAKPNERHVPKTFAGLLRAMLAPNQPAAGDVRLYEHGDARWQTLGPKGRPAPAQANVLGMVPGTPQHIRLAPTATRRERGLERTSPSALEGGRKLPAAMILKAGNAVAFGVGALMHAWMAEIEWLDTGRPDEAALDKVTSRLQGTIGHSLPPLSRLKSRFFELLKTTAVANVLSRDYYAHPAFFSLKAWPRAPVELTVHREWPFAIRTGDVILNGSIDRLVLVTSGGKPIAADILDFKTDDVAADDAQALRAKVEFYRPQLEAYRQAASQLLGLPTDQVKSRLVFLGAGRVEPV